MKKTQDQKKYCFCYGSNDDLSFSREDETFFKMMKLLSRQQEKGFEDVATILRDMKPKRKTNSARRKQLLYHLAGTKLTYEDVLNHVFQLPSSFKQHVWLWWGDGMVYSLSIKSIRFSPTGKKKKLRDFKDLVLQVKKIGKPYRPLYTYVWIRTARGLVFDIMDSYEKLLIPEIKHRLELRLKEVRYYNLPVKERMTGEEIGMLNAFLMDLRLPGIASRHCLLDLYRHPRHKYTRQIREKEEEKVYEEELHKLTALETVSIRRKETEHFIKKYEGKIDEAFIKQGYNPGMYKDVKQEVLTYIFNNIHLHSQRKTSPGGWIWRIVKYRTFGLTTKKEIPVPFISNLNIKELPVSDEIHPDYLNDIEEDVVDNGYTFDDQVTCKNVYKALSHLKPLHREPLILRAGGFTYRQIREILHQEGKLKNKNTNTVRSRVYHGRRKMERLIDRWGNILEEQYPLPL